MNKLNEKFFKKELTDFLKCDILYIVKERVGTMKGNYYRKATNRAKWFVGTKHQHAKRFRKAKIS